jgi:chromosome segregation ATPase
VLQFKETANPRDLQVLQDENNSLLEQMAQMKREFEDQLKEALDAGGSGQVESTNRESLDNLYTEIDKAKSERDHWQREYEMVRLERDTFESQYDEANNELKRLRVKAADDANQLEQARMTIEELHAQMTQMKQDVESLDIKSNQKQKMLQEITQREQAAQKQMKSAAISNKFKMGKDLVSKDKDRREKEQLQTLFDKTQEDLLDKQEVCAQLQDQLQHMKQQHASLAREKATFDQKEEAGMMRRAYLLQELTLKSRSVSELKLKNKELQKAIDRHNAKNPKWMRIGPKWALYATEGEGKTGGDAPQAPTE